jgi:quercetin dioxygenase-like cupin family protein
MRRSRPIGALLALLVLALAPAAVSAQAQETVLARGREDMPAAELMFRINDSSLPAGQPGVTHAHASGFDYAVEGTHVLTVGGTRQEVTVGRATWVGPQQEHTHADLGAGMRFWFFAVRPASTRGVPGVWPYPVRRIRSESEGFRLATAGPHDQVLSEVRLARPGDAVGPLARRGPVGVTVVEGQVGMGGRALAAEGVTIQWPDSRDAFTNTGGGPARLLALAVTPAGAAPAQLPRTGGSPVALQVALAAAAGLVVLGLVLGRSRGTRQSVDGRVGPPRRRP